MKLIARHPMFIEVNDGNKTIIFKKGIEEMIGWFQNNTTVDRIMLSTKTVADVYKKELIKEYSISHFMMSVDSCFIGD